MRDLPRPLLPEPFTNEWADLVFGLSDRDYGPEAEGEDEAPSESVVVEPAAYEEKKQEQEEQIERGYEEKGMPKEEAAAVAAATVKRVHMRDVDRFLRRKKAKRGRVAAPSGRGKRKTKKRTKKPMSRKARRR